MLYTHINLLFKVQDLKQKKIIFVVQLYFNMYHIKFKCIKISQFLGYNNKTSFGVHLRALTF